MSAEKLNWYVKNCFVKDIGEDRKETGKNVAIIKNQCYTQILNAKPISDSKVITELFRCVISTVDLSLRLNFTFQV